MFSMLSSFKGSRFLQDGRHFAYNIFNTFNTRSVLSSLLLNKLGYMCKRKLASL